WKRPREPTRPATPQACFRQARHRTTSPRPRWPACSAASSRGRRMDIHKPKPWHGLREFLKEYAIIVVGVLTALAAEQGVEWLRAQEAMDALRGGIRRELILDRAHWEAVRAQDACVAQRLDAILAWATSSPPQALATRIKMPRLW